MKLCYCEVGGTITQKPENLYPDYKIIDGDEMDVKHLVAMPDQKIVVVFNEKIPPESLLKAAKVPIFIYTPKLTKKQRSYIEKYCHTVYSTRDPIQILTDWLRNGKIECKTHEIYAIWSLFAQNIDGIYYGSNDKEVFKTLHVIDVLLANRYTKYFTLLLESLYDYHTPNGYVVRWRRS